MGVRICYVLRTSSSYPLYSTADVYFIIYDDSIESYSEGSRVWGKPASHMMYTPVSSMDALEVGRFFVRHKINYLMTSYINFLQNRFWKICERQES